MFLLYVEAPSSMAASLQSITFVEGRPFLANIKGTIAMNIFNSCSDSAVAYTVVFSHNVKS